MLPLPALVVFPARQTAMRGNLQHSDCLLRSDEAGFQREPYGVDVTRPETRADRGAAQLLQQVVNRQAIARGCNPV